MFTSDRTDFLGVAPGSCPIPLRPHIQHDITKSEILEQILRYANDRSETLPERRASPRQAFSQLIQLTPVHRDQVTIAGPPFHVVGREISRDGMGFYHTAAIPHRYVIAEFGYDEHALVRVAMQLIWCRFLREGWYDSGAQFLSLVHPAGRGASA